MPDKETLFRLYREDKLGIVNIGKLYNADKTLVGSWLTHYGIPRFTMSESAHLRILRSLRVVGKEWEPEPEQYLLIDNPTLISLEENGRISRIW